MTKPGLTEKRETLRAGILADTLARAVSWICFAAIVGGLALPVAWGAFKAHGIASGLAVLALLLALCWHVKPHGRSLRAQAREIEARFKPHD